MKSPILTATILSATCAIATFSAMRALHAAEQKAVLSGLEVVVKDAQADIDGYSTFAVSVKNSTQVAKTLSGTIAIQGAAGEPCTVYVEAPPQHTKLLAQHCRGRGVWTFTMGKVFDFILEE